MIRAVSGQFFRAIFAADAARVLDGAKTPEGRFHHDGEPALYMSPSPATARIATAAYLRPDDPPRVIVPLQVDNARLLDLREDGVMRDLGLQDHEPSVKWRPERVAGQVATSWQASDAARATDADGMIYASRSEPARWHIVLFHWNGASGPKVSINGPALAFEEDACS